MANTTDAILNLTHLSFFAHRATIENWYVIFMEQLVVFLQSNIEDTKHIYLPTVVALMILYIPIFLLSILNHSISKVSKWFLTLPIVLYLLVLPICLPVRAIPLFGTCVGSIGIYYAQKVCEWILIRRQEFNQWSFLDIQHELFHYRVYTQPIGVKDFEKSKKKEVFFTGPIQYAKHLRNLVSMTGNIVKYYILLDIAVSMTSLAFSSDFYRDYYLKYLSVRIVVNQLSGCMVFLLFMINYELLRSVLCVVFNRPLELMPDIFRQPYLAISPTDFWSRWHHVYRYTWIELIYKPVSRFLRHYWPKAPSSFTQSVSSISVFVFSGLMHEYFIYVTFGRFSGDQLLFFSLQGLAVIVECFLKRAVHPYQIPKSVGFLVTFIFNGITAGYFMQPWITFFNQNQKLKYSLLDMFSRHLFGHLS